MKRGMAIEFVELPDLFRAVRTVRELGVTRLEVYTPYPIPELDEMLGRRRSRLAVVAAIGALFGVTGGYFLEWLLNAYLYPVNAGGRPPHMPLAYMPITLEMGFLFGGLSVFFAFLFRSHLLRLWAPVFEIRGFESETRAGFWLAIDATDRHFAAAVAELASEPIEWFGDAP